MSSKILKVKSAEIKILKSNPPQLLITSLGWVSTAGWTEPVLVLSKRKPENGIYEFDYCATPPSGIVAQIIVPIEASYHFQEIPEDFKGVRINASQNSIEQSNGVEEEFNKGEDPYLENLLGIECVEGKLKVRTYTGGSTTKESFKINVIKGFTGMPPYLVEIYRVQPDYSRGYFPEGVLLEWSLDELGIESNAYFTLANKIGKRE